MTTLVAVRRFDGSRLLINLEAIDSMYPIEGRKNNLYGVLVRSGILYEIEETDGRRLIDYIQKLGVKESEVNQ
jgi:hypothetical protein